MTKEQAEITARVAKEIYNIPEVEVYEPVSIEKENNYSVVSYTVNPDGTRYYDEYGDDYSPVPEYAADIKQAMSLINYFNVRSDKAISDYSLKFYYSDRNSNWSAMIELPDGSYARYTSSELPSILCRCMLYANSMS